jgi:hypothetical protein
VKYDGAVKNRYAALRLELLMALYPGGEQDSSFPARRAPEIFAPDPYPFIPGFFFGVGISGF